MATVYRYKYAETLEKHVHKYLKKFGITRAICTNEFEYYPECNSVCFTIFQYDQDAELVKSVNQKYDVQIDKWFFVFCLLHEVGHKMTLPQLTEEEMHFEEVARNGLLPLLIEDKDNTKINALYFNLPAEDLANRWAIDYIDTHQEECWKFQQRCEKIIEHIYNKKCFAYHRV